MNVKRGRRFRSVCVIGQMGNLGTEFNGQSIKTLNFVRLLNETGWFDTVTTVDTRNVSARKWTVLFNVLVGLWTCRDVVLMVSANGKAFFYPFLYCLSRLVPIRVFQNVIGGTLPLQLEARPSWVRFLNGFESNWAETPKMVEELAAYGVSNAIYVPNFRFRSTDTKLVSEKPLVEPLRFCTFSRVTESKGVTEAIVAVSEVNSSAGRVVASLDIYGDIDPSYRARFLTLVNGAGSFVRYCGAVSSEDSRSILQEYFMLLFPSRHPGEGLPGTLIDALHARLPVVASDWRFNAEIIRHGKEGLIVDVSEEGGLSAAITYALAHPLEIRRMSLACESRADLYSQRSVTDRISPYFAPFEEAAEGAYQ